MNVTEGGVFLRKTPQTITAATTSSSTSSSFFKRASPKHYLSPSLAHSYCMGLILLLSASAEGKPITALVPGYESDHARQGCVTA
jgi:hypothetical protein